MENQTKLFKLGLIYLCLHLGCLLFYWLKNRPDGRLRLIMCDVGQGEAILIITPKGKQILVDAGPDNRVLECLGDYLLPWGKTLEAIVVTHPQSDHTTGLWYLSEGYENNRVYISAISLKFIKQIKSDHSNDNQKRKFVGTINILERGDQFSTDQVYFNVVWPSDHYHLEDTNDNSLVLRLKYKDFSALLTGDTTEKVWNYLELSNQLPPRTTLLKIPHHGAKNCCTQGLIESVRPQLALISAGKNNQFGHPHPETIRLFEDSEVMIKRTDLEGNIELVI